MTPVASRARSLAACLGAACLGLVSCAPEAPRETSRPTPVVAARTSGAELDPLAAVPGRRPTPREDRALARLLHVAEDIRDLRFERPVPFRIQDRETITEFVREQADAEELERARVFYVALGLLPPDLDVHELLIRVLGEQIVGYYDPDDGLMVIREDVAAELSPSSGRDRELGEAEMVIVHELVHALQDQRLGLGANYDLERTIDAENAFASLVEGDATLAMIGHLAGRNGQTLTALTRNAPLLRMLVANSPPSAAGQEIESAPPIIRIPLVSRYLEGMLFCATLHGGSGWAGVDSAHRVAPASTEQVMHPERFVAGELPDPITLPAFPELAAAGLTPHDEDETLGELETGIYFGVGSAGASDRGAAETSAAAGWGGDRLRVYRDTAGGTAVVWFTSWDDVGEAIEAEVAARAVLARVEAAEQGRHRVERLGRAVLIVRGLDPALHGPVQLAFTAMSNALSERPPSSVADRRADR